MSVCLFYSWTDDDQLTTTFTTSCSFTTSFTTSLHLACVETGTVNSYRSFGAHIALACGHVLPHPIIVTSAIPCPALTGSCRCFLESVLQLNF